ncbi:MAG: hypothetical protein ACYDCN_01245 [Bacteroidia bacterium]
MKKTKLMLILCGLMMTTVLFISSCQKKKETTTTPPDTNTSSASDNNTSESASKDINNIGSESIDNGSLSTYRLGGGLLSPMSGSVTITPDTTNKKVTVLFTGFVGRDGNTRNGTLVYSWAGSFHWFKDAGFNIQVTTPFNDYTVSNPSSGTFTISITKKSVRNLGNTGGNYTWSDTANLTIAKPSGGGTITWNRTGTMVLLNTNQITYAGVSVPGVYGTLPGPGGIMLIDWAHAVIGFTGNATGTNAGSSYTANITNRVEYNFNCSPTSYTFFHPPVAGSIDFTPSGKPTRTINYGTGTCDDTYTVTIGTYSVQLSFI